jgi:DMSO/TMAO reductase YedYZ molybdopterin-dependent catalytic subunit
MNAAGDGGQPMKLSELLWAVPGAVVPAGHPDPLIGGLQYDVSKTYFEQALACQFGSDHKAAYTDSKGRAWEGMPLWFLAGFVDDADQHSNNSFNDALAQAGYQVVITAADGYSVTIASADIIRNSDYIVANSLNGELIPDSDSNWPLRLVGPAVNSGTSISQIVRIELVKIPSNTLTIDVNGNGTVTKDPDQETYASGTQVTITAIPAAGYEFTGWSGDLVSTDNPATVVMNSNMSITANFEVTYALAIDITGNGTVTKDPDQETYASGTQVTITAIPAAGYEFTGWSGDLVSTDNPATVVMNSNMAISADFEVTYDSLGSMVEIVVECKGIAKSLLAKLGNAGEADARGSLNAKEGMMKAFINEIEAQTGKCIGSSDAAMLISLANQLVGQWQDGVISEPAAALPQTPPALNADTMDNTVGQPADISFADDESWRAAVTDVTVEGASIAGQYTVTAGNLNINSGVFTTAADYAVAVKADGYEDTAVIQTMNEELQLLIPPVLTADSKNNTVSRSVYNETGLKIDITFTDDAVWRAAITGVTANGTPIIDQYSVVAGVISIDAGLFTAEGDYGIIILASGYEDNAVIQTIESRKNKPIEGRNNSKN